MSDEASVISLPTEEHPDYGVIRHVEYGVELCASEHWVEDGLHVIRAADFDLMAVDEDHKMAVGKFVEEAYSLVAALGDLIVGGQATKQENELYTRLAVPILQVAQRERGALQDQQSRYIDFPRLRRRRGEHAGAWGQALSHGKSNQLSIA